jgi:MFS family permease
MSVCGTAGVATLVGPLTGGVLVDGLGWEWIFFSNVPIGTVGLALQGVFTFRLDAAARSDAL